MFISRRDHQIKHMGHRIELGEIESAVSSHEYVHTACCIFDEEKKRIVLFYAGEADSAVVAADLKEKLPRYMLPNRIRQLPELPTTPNGKLDRNHLKQMYMEEKL